MAAAEMVGVVAEEEEQRSEHDKAIISSVTP